MPKRIESRLLEPFYVKGVPVVPVLFKTGHVVHAVGNYDENGPLETEDDVIRTARRWQKRPAKLDRKPRSVDSKGNDILHSPL